MGRRSLSEPAFLNIRTGLASHLFGDGDSKSGREKNQRNDKELYQMEQEVEGISTNHVVWN